MDYLVHHLLTSTVKKCPNKEALIDGDQRLKYTEIEELTNRLAIAC